jgi:hypothetical protein
MRLAHVFSYDKQGHFAAQTQYLSKQADKDNGKYCVQCRQGKVTAIFIKYSPPISREQSVLAMQRLVGNEPTKDIDASELTSKASTLTLGADGKPGEYYCPPSEYVYFDHSKSAELLFVSPDDHRVTDLMVWG